MQRFHLVSLQLGKLFGLIDRRLFRRYLWIDGFLRKLQPLLFDLIAIRQFGLFYL